jgi:hypothetical protein
MRRSATRFMLGLLMLLLSGPVPAEVKDRIDELDSRVTSVETSLQAALREMQELLNLIKAATPGRVCDMACVGEEAAQFSVTTSGGECTPKITYPCHPYRCFAPFGTCLTECVSDNDCAATHRCKDGQCLLRPAYCSDDPNNLTPGDGRYVVTSDRRVINCLPYVCGEFGCKERCSSKLDCYDGYVCGADGDCLPPIGP